MLQTRDRIGANSKPSVSRFCFCIRYTALRPVSGKPCWGNRGHCRDRTCDLPVIYRVLLPSELNGHIHKLASPSFNAASVVDGAPAYYHKSCRVCFDHIRNKNPSFKGCPRPLPCFCQLMSKNVADRNIWIVSVPKNRKAFH